MTISKKRMAEIAAIAEEDIDTSEIPEVTEDFFKGARLVLPPDDASSAVRPLARRRRVDRPPSD